MGKTRFKDQLRNLRVPYKGIRVEEKASKGPGSIDCSDDAMMVRIGMRPPLVERREKKALTDRERLEIQVAKSSSRGLSGKSIVFDKSKRFDSIGRLTVHVLNLRKEKDFRTTHSCMCKSSEILEYISDFLNGETVSKVYYSGKKVDFKYEGSNIIIQTKIK